MDDHFERLQRIKDNAETLLAFQAETDAKFENEIDKLEFRLLLSVALGALRAAAPDVKHERVRVQVNGARDMLQKALAG